MLSKKKQCDVKDCTNEHTSYVFDRDLKVAQNVCDEHRSLILQQDFPEYVIKCGACGCQQGVN